MASLNTKLATTPNVSANYVLKATTSTTIGNSLIFDNGTSVAIGTTAPDSGAPFTIEKTGAGLQTLAYFQNLQAAAADTGTSIYFLGTSGLNSLGRIVNAWEGASNTASYMSFWTRGSGTTSERLRITSAGNVGIGTGSPTYKLEVNGIIAGKATGNGGRFETIDSTTGANLTLNAAFNSGEPAVQTQTNSPILFVTNNTERMRLNTTGALFIGTTTDPGAGSRLGIVNGFGMEGLCVKMGSTGAYSPIAVRDTTGAEMFNIRENGAMDNPYAYNTTTGSAANVFVNTIGRFLRSSSSLKYKTDVRDYDKGLAEVLQMRPVYYKGKSEDDGDTQFAGLIAEEIHDLGLTEFVQYANDGTPDALAYQNMVALLTKAIQDLHTKLQDQQQTINSLINR